MSIRPAINARALNERLGNLECAAEYAPEGTYAEAKTVAALISDLANHIMHEVSAAGLKVRGDDTMREVEAVLYGYILDSNPEAYGLITGEGFGEHVRGPAGERMIAQAAANRDFLEAERVIGSWASGGHDRLDPEF